MGLFQNVLICYEGLQIESNISKSNKITMAIISVAEELSNLERAQMAL